MAGSVSVAGLLEHTKAKGIDVCSSTSSLYIIRSDLGCYMKVDNYYDSQQKLTVFPLNPYCANGDHYANDGKMFYIIQGDTFISVSDLSFPTDNSISVQTLHESCRNGEHFMFAYDCFYVIFSDT